MCGAELTVTIEDGLLRLEVVEKSQKSIRQYYEELANRFGLSMVWVVDKPDTSGQ